jgi:hypothetical protein
MKKYLIGFMVGIIVAATGTAYADDVVESIVGKKIEGQFPVKISGKQLDVQAAVVDGTSYLPVRAIGEALNMDVSFNADLGIELKSKGEANVPETPQATPIPAQPATGPTDEILVDSTQSVEYQIKYLKDEISSIEMNLLIWKDELIRVTNMTEERKQKTNELITKSETRLAAMKALIEQLQQQ